MSDTPAEAASQNGQRTGASPSTEVAVAVPAVETSWLEKLWQTIQEHKIGQWTLAYAAFAAAVLQGASVVSEAFEWPHVIVRGLTLVLIVGLLIVPILASYHGGRALTHTSRAVLILMALLLVTGASWLWLSPPTLERASSSAESVTAPASEKKPDSAAEIFAPPAHSIAVLPFVNMSGDAEQEYFSDGISEELLNALSRLNELQVAARTSSFLFKERNADIASIGRKLNVGAVLEGSVRKAGNQVRITVQLINTQSGFHLWSQTYDRDLRDILRLQAEIAAMVTDALKVKLLGDVARKIELGGTKNPQAFDAYLRGMNIADSTVMAKIRAALAAFDEAVALDPSYAVAYAARSEALIAIAGQWTSDLAIQRAMFAQARAAAEKAVALAPELGSMHVALGTALERGFFDFAGAAAAYERAISLTPGDASVQRDYALFAAYIGGRADKAVAAARRAIELDPLSSGSHWAMGQVLYLGRRYVDALASFQRGRPVGDESDATDIGLAQLGLGRPESARAACAKAPPNYFLARVCLAIALHSLGRPNEAEAELGKLRAARGDLGAFRYAEIYAQWGHRAEALKWLATAYRLRIPGLAFLRTDPLLDPIRDAPEFQAIERKLKFPT